MSVEDSSPDCPARGETVLICDDESRLATLTAGLLEEFGYSCVTVGLGDDALKLLRAGERQIDILLLDVNLSAGISAGELLSQLDREGRALPVILTSGLAPEDVPRQLREHVRVAGYLGKPYTVDELVSAINEALAA